MEGRLVLKDCAIFRADGRVRTGMAVVVDHERISEVAPNHAVSVRPGDWEIACQGRLVSTGLVDCHSHLVGGQLLPISGDLLLRPPHQRMELMRALTGLLRPSEVEVLSAFAMAKAIRAGVTLVVEHLTAPSDVLGSLESQARVAERLGLRLSNSHASFSGGEIDGEAQVEANAAYVSQRRAVGLVRPAMGFHASYTSDDSLLRRLGSFRERLGAPLQYHLAESEEDLTQTYTRYQKRIVQRLEGFGLLCAGAVAAYARAIDRGESERLSRTRVLVALSPRTDLAGEPGGGGFEAVFAYPNLLGLGTGGQGLLWGELVSAFTGVVQIARAGRLLDPDGFMGQLLMSGPAELCTMLYGAPSGTIEPGALADLVVFDHIPAEERPGGLAPHLLLQLGQARVAWSIINGRVVMREGQLLGHDFLELGREAARVLSTLWRKVQQ